MWTDIQMKRYLGRYQRSSVPMKSEAHQSSMSRWLSGKESACSSGDVSPIPGSGRSPGETGNSCLHSCRKISWTEEPDGLQSLWWQNAGHYWATEHAHVQGSMQACSDSSLEALWTKSFWVFMVGFPGSAWVFIKTSLNTRRDWLNHWPLRAMKFQPSKSHGRPSSLSCLCALQKSVH